eukprot:GFUD01039145.1.p2 GENE.GFUD01039145.1~~GFUD01039145.1.p2  ORF type:complete len:107 (-),score=35.81 GFUD01039145.1:67-387(-)
MNFSILVLTMVASIFLTAGNEISPELMEEETLAFMACNSDGNPGLTWMEVKQCEETFAELLDAQKRCIPSDEDFKSADLNGDGTLEFEEWKEWVEGQGEERNETTV